MINLTAWDDLDLETRKAEYEKQALAYKYRETLKEWDRNYIALARALADAFGETEVLDILEQTWWQLQYEGGLSWREDFDRDPRAAFRAMFEDAHNGAQSLTSGAYEVEFHDDHYEVLMLYCYHKDVTLEMDERKIGISRCMADLAAARGACPRLVMHFSDFQIRGVPYCHATKDLIETAPPNLDRWSRETSEKYGWRSIKMLEE